MSNYDEWKQETPESFGEFYPLEKCPLCLEEVEELVKKDDLMICLECAKNEQ